MTFSTHADIAEPGYQSFHTYMVTPHEGAPDPDTNRSDPLTRNDPWSASASQSWSLPTSAPQSLAPHAPQPDISRYAASGYFRAPFNVFRFGRTAVSEPAVASTSEQPFSRVSAEPVPSAEPPSSHPPVQVTQEPAHVPNMQWASVAHMPQELRDLLPWPVLPVLPNTPTVPAFAERPGFGFLDVREPPGIPAPPSSTDSDVGRSSKN